MSSYRCAYCSEVKDESQFYAQSRRRCKRCTNAANVERYRGKYGPEKMAARRAANRSLKEPRIVHSDVERAYAAGLIDGEGSIRITERGKNGGTTFTPGQRTLMVELTNTAKPMVEWLNERWPGSVNFLPASEEGNRKARWHWRLAANRALAFLDEILEYLVVKRRQAVLGRRFQRYVQIVGRPRSERLEKVQVRFYAEFRRLNRRGFIPQEQ